MAEKLPRLYVTDDDDPDDMPAPPAASLSAASRQPADHRAAEGIAPTAAIAADDDADDFCSDGQVTQGEALGTVKQRIDESNSRLVTRSTLLNREAEREQQRYVELLATLEPEPPFWARWLGSPGLTWTLVLCVAGFGLFVLAQVTLLISQLVTLPLPGLRYAGYAAVGVLLAACAIAAWRLLRLYMRLRQGPHLRTDALYQLAARQRIGAAYARRAFDHVYAQLRSILVGYPLDDEACVLKLKACGATGDELERLKTIQQKLLGGQEEKIAWITAFDKRFLGLLDDIAIRRVRRAALNAGKLTAVAPRGVIDVAIVSALAVDLVSDLCLLYNLRASRIDTVRILFTAILHAGVASQADHLTQSVADQLFHTLQSDTSWLTAILGKIATPVTGGVADGVINGSLLYRLGRLTIRALRPLQ